MTRFGALRSAIQSAPERLIFFAFDLLHLDGEDLRDDPLLARRLRLQDLVGADAGSRIQFSADYEGDGAAFFRAADRHGLEGIVSKRADSRYTAGESRAWRKTKCFALGDFQVVGRRAFVDRSAGRAAGDHGRGSGLCRRSDADAQSEGTGTLLVGRRAARDAAGPARRADEAQGRLMGQAGVDGAGQAPARRGHAAARHREGSRARRRAVRRCRTEAP